MERGRWMVQPYAPCVSLAYRDTAMLLLLGCSCALVTILTLWCMCVWLRGCVFRDVSMLDQA